MRSARALRALLAKELAVLFGSPIAYVVLTMVTFVTAFVFWVMCDPPPGPSMVNFAGVIGLVLAGLIIGKPIGILFFGWLGAVPFKLGLPAGMRIIDLFVIGCIAAIGFTVSLFIASVAFEPGPVQDAAKMGALFSFAAAIISIIAGRLCRVEKQTH